jgi:uncharacterized radical SAM superfamily Fe-S cluster-containing enzyme
MKKPSRPHVLHATTESLCAECLARIPAKVVLRDGEVWLLKRCPAHGAQEALLEEDADWYVRRTEWDKPGTASRAETAAARGCPDDCGLCPDHEQHTCIGVVEITDACDLACPACYAGSGARAGEPIPIEHVRRMLDAYAAAEGGRPEVLQLSGGEPTTHPGIVPILEEAMDRGFRYVMLNTNGLRIDADDAFADALGRIGGKGGFEVYLQFDGVSERGHRHLRGRELGDVKRRAISRLAERNVPVTLVVTVAAGVNDDEVGALVAFGLETPGVRGINFQPLARFGRTPPGAQDPRPVTLTGVLKRLEAQMNGMLRRDDFIPLPCDTDRVAIGYLYRETDGFVPILREADVRKHLPLVENTLAFDTADVFRQTAAHLFEGGGFCRCLDFFRQFRPLAPLSLLGRSAAEQARYVTEHTFRITVTSFLDRFNFERRAMQKECVHVITPDLRRVPFSAWNLLHREAAR